MIFSWGVFTGRCFRVVPFSLDTPLAGKTTTREMQRTITSFQKHVFPRGLPENSKAINQSRIQWKRTSGTWSSDQLQKVLAGLKHVMLL
jgi:hypothetical protein